MHSNLVTQGMRLVAHWELDGVVASQGARLARIKASTPTPVECAAIALHLSLPGPDEDLSGESRWQQIDIPICEVISRCERNEVGKPIVSSMPLLNCCSDLFPVGRLEGIREEGRVESEAFAKCLETPEFMFLHDSLCYHHFSRLRRHLLDTDPTLTLEDGAFKRIERAIMERVLQKIA